MWHNSLKFSSKFSFHHLLCTPLQSITQRKLVQCTVVVEMFEVSKQHGLQAVPFPFTRFHVRCAERFQLCEKVFLSFRKRCRTYPIEMSTPADVVSPCTHDKHTQLLVAGFLNISVPGTLPVVELQDAKDVSFRPVSHRTSHDLHFHITRMHFFPKFKPEAHLG